MTLAEAGIKALKLANRYSSGGDILTGRRIADYQHKFNSLANDAQQELARIAKISDVHKFVLNEFPPAVTSSFETYNFEGGTDYVLAAASGINAVSFKVTTDTFTVEVFEETSTDVWTRLLILSDQGVYAPTQDERVEPDTDDGGFKEYKFGLAIASTSNTVKIVCSGDYAFSIKDYALWTIKPQPAAYEWHWDDTPGSFDNSSIPQFSEFLEYELPSDFMELNENMQITDRDRFIINQLRFDKANSMLYVPYDLKGEMRIFYYKKPTEIDEDTADTYEFELTNDIALSAIPYYMTGVMIAEDVGDMANFCMQRYAELIAQIKDTDVKQDNIKSVENTLWKRRSRCLENR